MKEVIAFCGAGGKTSTIFEYRDELCKNGRKVFITTSTHMLREPFTNVSLYADDIIEQMNREGFVMAGAPVDDGHASKIAALPAECYRKVCAAADAVLIEADGSRHMSVKCPNDFEPAIPDNVNRIVIVMGLWDIGKRVGDCVHRSELLEKKLNISPDELLSREIIDRIINECYVTKIKALYPRASYDIIYREHPRGGFTE